MEGASSGNFESDSVEVDISGENRGEIGSEDGSAAGDCWRSDSKGTVSPSALFCFSITAPPRAVTKS